MSTGPGTDDNGDAEKGVAGELRADRRVGDRDLTRWTTAPGQRLAGLAEALGRTLGARWALILVLAVGVAVATTMTWLASETYEAVVDAEGVATWDQPLLDTSLTMRSPETDALVTAYTHVGGTIVMPVLTLSAMAALALRRRSWTPVVLVTAAAVGSLLMTVAGKDLAGRERPPLASAVPPYEDSASFPSGHSLNAIVIAGVFAYLLVLRQESRRSRVVTLVLAALFAVTMGLSRVFLGHHWFTDVLAAWALGLGWLAVVVTAHRLYLTAQRRGRDPTPSG